MAVNEPPSKSVGLRERNRRATHDRLIQAARQLLAEQGAFTADEIAARALVSRATYFNYFPGKDDLLRALYVEHMDALAAVVDDLLARELSMSARIVGVFESFALGADAYGDYLRAVTSEFERTFADPLVSAMHTEMFNVQMLRILDVAADTGELRTDLPVRFLAQMVAAVYVSAVRSWRHEPTDDVTTTFRQAGRYVAESFTPRPPPTES